MHGNSRYLADKVAALGVTAARCGRRSRGRGKWERLPEGLDGARRVMHAHGGRTGRSRVRMPVRLHLCVLACLFICTSVAAVIGFVRELAHSPAEWPVAVAVGVAGAVGSMAAWRRFLRMPSRRVIKSRLVNALAGVLALGLFIFLMAIFSQVYGDLMYRVVPIS